MKKIVLFIIALLGICLVYSTYADVTNYYWGGTRLELVSTLTTSPYIYYRYDNDYNLAIRINNTNAILQINRNETGWVNYPSNNKLTWCSTYYVDWVWCFFGFYVNPNNAHYMFWATSTSTTYHTAYSYLVVYDVTTGSSVFNAEVDSGKTNKFAYDWGQYLYWSWLKYDLYSLSNSSYSSVPTGVAGGYYWGEFWTEEQKNCYDDEAYYDTYVTDTLSSIDVDNSYWGYTWYWLSNDYPFYVYGNDIDTTLEWYNITLLPEPVDYSSGWLNPRDNMKNLTLSWVLSFETQGYISDVLDYTSIQGFHINQSMQPIEYFKLDTASGSEFQFYLYDKYQQKIWTQKYSTNEPIYLDWLGIYEIYLWVDTSYNAKEYIITELSTGYKSREVYVIRVCEDVEWQKYIDGNAVEDDVLEELTDPTSNNTNNDYIDMEELYGSWTSFNIIFWAVGINDSGDDNDCNPIFDEDWNFNYIKTWTVSKFFTKISYWNAFILGDRWELVILDKNVIGWLYDFVDFFVKQIQKIVWYILNNTLGLFLDFFSALRIPERNNNYCFLGVNMYLDSSVSSYYSYKDRETITVDDTNGIEYILIICMSFFILITIFKFL